MLESTRAGVISQNMDREEEGNTLIDIQENEVQVEDNSQALDQRPQEGSNDVDGDEQELNNEQPEEEEVTDKNRETTITSENRNASLENLINNAPSHQILKNQNQNDTDSEDF